jgi:hypothetical protein
MMHFRSMPNSLRLALLALSLSFVFFGWSIFRAVNPGDVVPTGSASTPQVLAPEVFVPVRSAQISQAVDRDPFNPMRTRPAQPYRLASELAAIATTQQRARLRWAGVIMQADGTPFRLSVALGTGNNAPVQTMKIGEVIGDYTLKVFDMKRATFQSSSGELVLLTNPRPGI